MNSRCQPTGAGHNDRWHDVTRAWHKHCRGEIGWWLGQQHLRLQADRTMLCDTAIEVLLRMQQQQALSSNQSQAE